MKFMKILKSNGKNLQRKIIFPIHRRPKFFKNREEGFKALRSRATYYRNKGVELQKFHDEIKKYAGPTKINWKHLADFARQVKNQ